MKKISILIIITIVIAFGIVTARPKENKAEFANDYCGYAIGCQSYEVLEAISLDELKGLVQKGIDKASWRPEGGIAYNGETKRYLQVMVHPRKLPSYP